MKGFQCCRFHIYSLNCTLCRQSNDWKHFHWKLFTDDSNQSIYIQPGFCWGWFYMHISICCCLIEIKPLENFFNFVLSLVRDSFFVPFKNEFYGFVKHPFETNFNAFIVTGKRYGWSKAKPVNNISDTRTYPIKSNEQKRWREAIETTTRLGTITAQKHIFQLRYFAFIQRRFPFNTSST